MGPRQLAGWPPVKQYLSPGEPFAYSGALAKLALCNNSPTSDDIDLRKLSRLVDETRSAVKQRRA